MSIDTNNGDDDTPPIYHCPVDDCSRTVVSDRTALVNHVLNLQDDGHEGKALNEDLELVDEYGDWSPGAPDELPDDPGPRFPGGYTIRPASMTDW